MCIREQARGLPRPQALPDPTPFTHYFHCHLTGCLWSSAGPARYPTAPIPSIDFMPMPDELNESPNPDSGVARSNPNFGAKTCLFSAMVVFGLLIIGAFFIIRRFRPELPPKLTRTSFDAAWNQWDENEPPDYEIQIKVVGPRPATYHVKVENGTVVSANRNDVALPEVCLLYTSPSPRDATLSRMPSSA